MRITLANGPSRRYVRTPSGKCNNQSRDWKDTTLSAEILVVIRVLAVFTHFEQEK